MTFNKITKNLFKKNNLLSKDYVILIVLFVIFSLSIDIFRKSYFIISLDHDPEYINTLRAIKNQCNITRGFWGFHNQKKGFLLYML